MRFIRLSLRFLRIFFTVWASLAIYLWNRLVAGRIDPVMRERLRGDVLAGMLERLGATFVKFGQILSTRPDLLGPGYIAALRRLQDAVPPMPFSHVEQVLEEELGSEWRLQIPRIEADSVAAASVAQVHRAWLGNGEEVALKIQRIEARAQIEVDLAIMAIGARMIDWIPSVHFMSLPGALERFAHALHGQLDFRQEAANNRRFAENFADVDGVSVPRLMDSLCTRRLLAMEFIHGVPATEPERVGGDRRLLARQGANAILQMVFIDGFVHADLHPGNIFLVEGGGVVLIDLGLVAEIPGDLMRPWVETFTALGQANGPELARLFYIYSPHVGTDDYAAYEKEIIEYFARFYGASLGEVEVSVIISGVMNVLRRHRVKIDSSFTVVNIGLLVAEGLGKQLDPSIDLVQQAMPYLFRALESAPPGRPPVRSVPSS